MIRRTSWINKINLFNEDDDKDLRTIENFVLQSILEDLLFLNSQNFIARLLDTEDVGRGGWGGGWWVMSVEQRDKKEKRWDEERWDEKVGRGEKRRRRERVDGETNEVKRKETNLECLDGIPTTCRVIPGGDTWRRASLPCQSTRSLLLKIYVLPEIRSRHSSTLCRR